jgi:hypothetical protein
MGARRDCDAAVLIYPERMTEDEARSEARRRNIELGEQRPATSFWLEVQLRSGEWDVEERSSATTAKDGWLEGIINALLSPFGH